MLRSEIAAFRGRISWLVFVKVQGFPGSRWVKTDILQKLPRGSRSSQMLRGKFPGLVALWRNCSFHEVAKVFFIFGCWSSKVFKVGNLFWEMLLIIHKHFQNKKYSTANTLIFKLEFARFKFKSVFSHPNRNSNKLFSIDLYLRYLVFS